MPLVNKYGMELLLNECSLIARQYYSSSWGVVSKGSTVANAWLKVLWLGRGQLSLLSEALLKWPSGGPWKGVKGGNWTPEGRRGGKERRLEGHKNTNITDLPRASLTHFIMSPFSKPKISFPFIFLLKRYEDNYKGSFWQKKTCLLNDNIFILTSSGEHIF